jgi:hypothetical protein
MPAATGAATPNLALPYIAPAQAMKHVTHNEAIRALDGLVQLAVLDRDRQAPPAAPADGDRYIVAAGATGAWAGKAGRVAAYQDGAWAFFTPRAGWVAWIAAEQLLVVHDGSGWGRANTGDTVPRLGIGTRPDAVNRLAAKGEAVLFSCDDGTPGQGSVRLKLNKADPAQTASLVFQTGFSGRAEIGTTGADRLAIKTSADGAAWKEAVVVQADGRVGIGTADPRADLAVAGASPTLAVEYTATGIGAAAAVSLRGPAALGTQAQTLLQHANAVDGATAATFSILAANAQGVATGPLAFYDHAATRWSLCCNYVARLTLEPTALRPGVDNAMALGTSTRRWGTVFAVNGTIQSSDARDKAEIRPLGSDLAGGLVDRLAPILFRWTVGGRDVAEAPGAAGEPVLRDRPGRRQHAGFRAQDLKAALDDLGVDFGAWGLMDAADPDSRQWIRPDQLVPVLWRAVADLRADLAALRRGT